jgi:hypothetical protein
VFFEESNILLARKLLLENEMKSKILVSLFSLMLIVSIAGGVCVVKADTTGEPKVSYDTWGEWPRWQQNPENPNLIILSPLPNEVLRGNTVSVRLNISSPAWPINSVYYKADWQEGMHRIYSVNNHTSTRMLYRLSITANFTHIPDGTHRLTFYANIHDGSQGSSSVDFTINAPPSIVILSPENKTYETADLPLNFTVNKPMKWAGYSLDEKENITVTGNSTITSLTDGFHSITVYANDTSGNIGASQTMNFSVDKPIVIKPLNSTQTIITVAVAIAVVVAIGVGLQIYRKKHKRI